MKPEPSPREELEVRLTALLLGELSPEETTPLQEAIAKNPELARLQDRLRQTIALVRETVATPEQELLASTATPKLSAERREKLLDSFKVPRPPELSELSGRRQVNWREWASLAAMLTVLGGVAGAMLITARSRSMATRSMARASLQPDVGFFQERKHGSDPQDREVLLGSLSAGTTAEDRPVKSSKQPLGEDVPQNLSAMASESKSPAPGDVPWFDRIDNSKGNSKGKSERKADINEALETRTPGRSSSSPTAGALEEKRARGGKLEIAADSKSEAVPNHSFGFVTRSSQIVLPASSEPTQAPVPGSPISGVQNGADVSGVLLVPGDRRTGNGIADGGGGVGGGGVGSGNGARSEFLKLPQYGGAAAIGGVTGSATSLGVEDGAALGSNMSRRSGAPVRPFLKETLGDETKVLTVDGLVRMAKSESNPTALAKASKPPAESAGTSHFNVPIALPDQNGREYLAERESQVQAGAVVTAEIQSGPKAAMKEKPAGAPKDKAIAAQTPQVQVSDGDMRRDKEQKLDLLNDSPPIVKLAEAGDKIRSNVFGRAWRKLVPETARTARIAVEKDTKDALPAGQQNGTVAAFDPYFVQTEAEFMRSGEVLNEVIDKLKLNEAWGGRQGGAPLDNQETLARLNKRIEVRADPKTGVIDIRAKGENAGESALIANTVALAYADSRKTGRQNPPRDAVTQNARIPGSEGGGATARAQGFTLRLAEPNSDQEDINRPKPAATAAIPQPDMAVAENPFSTFSLNVSDVSFKLAAASLEKDQMPDPATVRSEEFVNAFEYHDPEPQGGAPVAFAWERARYPFAHDRDLIRFSIKTAASGRQPGRPMNLVLLLDNSGSMERADRVAIIHECLRILAGQLEPQDTISVVAFARTARLWIDGLAGNQAGELPQRLGDLVPQGGTNLEEAMNLAYQTARRHYLPTGVNRVVLLTDGAANLGDVEPESLRKQVETHRRQGIALDCFGIGWEGYNDDLLESLSRNGDGRYGFVNSIEAADTEFAGQLAGALHVAASDVKVQVEFNPRRATAYRQIGYAKHQLTKEQFRDNTVDAAEIGAAEAGNALYVVQVNPAGEGPIATVRVRFKVPGTSDYREHEWAVPYEGQARPLEQSNASLRLAGVASAFSEWLVASPFAGGVTTDRLLNYIRGVPDLYPADARPRQLEGMIQQARRLVGK